MFEARFAKGSLLHKLVDAVKDIVDCVNLNCTQEGLFIQVRCVFRFRRFDLTRSTL